jgi:RNAse (barnase) inhibitor barstar
VPVTFLVDVLFISAVFLGWVVLAFAVAVDFASELSRLWSVVTVEAVALPLEMAFWTALDCNFGVFISAMYVSLAC